MAQDGGHDPTPLWEREEFRSWSSHIAVLLSRAGSALNTANTMATDFNERFENSRLAMYVVDASATVIRANGAFAAALGRGSSEVVGAPLSSLIDDVGSGEESELIRYRRADGGFLWAWASICPMATVAGAHLVQLVEVTSEIDLLLGALADRDQLVETDPLTGLDNREAAQLRLSRAIDMLRDTNRGGVAAVAIDIDNFTALNDLYGQAFGDFALVRFADLATTALEGRFPVGRLGGDEFLVTFDNIGSSDEARQALELLDGAVGSFVIQVGGSGPVTVTTSMGLAWTSDPVDPIGILSSAFERLVVAKNKGRGELWLPSDAQGDAAAVGPTIRRELLGELRVALDERQFVLYYQPVVDPAGALVGVEALIRWRHPTRGVLAPDSFVPLLLESGLMSDVGVWVLDAGLAQVAQWRDEFGADVKLSVNASAGELDRPEYLEAIVDSLARHRVAPGSLSVELTEQMLSGETVTHDALNGIAALGVHVVLDDFGTGISSLSHLRNVALTGVKIDRSFVSETSPGDIDRRIVRGVTEMAHGLGVQVTAEGIETQEQAEWICSLGIDLLQGYYFGRPVPAEALIDMVLVGDLVGTSVSAR